MLVPLFLVCAGMLKKLELTQIVEDKNPCVLQHNVAYRNENTYLS